jgi:hypothetical protein
MLDNLKSFCIFDSASNKKQKIKFMKTLNATKIVLIVAAIAVILVAAYFMVQGIPTQYRTY